MLGRRLFDWLVSAGLMFQQAAQDLIDLLGLPVGLPLRRVYG
jgi:hypothetical protein